MRWLDFSSWQGVLSTLGGLLLITLVGVGIRLVLMQTVQARQQAANRQINERLKTLIAAYKTLGGSFTGDLSVDPRHLREIRQQAAEHARALAAGEAVTTAEGSVLLPEVDSGEAGERARRIRDADTVGDDEVGHARELVDALDGDAGLLQAGPPGAQGVGVHGARVRPRDDRQMAEDAVEVDRVGLHEQVREQVQAQVRV